jgi:hypothetical protein
MAYDPWDWTKQVPMQQLAIPLAAMPQAQASAVPSPMNTTGPLTQMVQGAVINRGMDKALKDDPVPKQLAPVVDSTTPVPGTGPQVGGPMTGGGESLTSTPLAPLGTDAAAAQGAEIATAAAPAEGGFASIAAMAGK